MVSGIADVISMLSVQRTWYWFYISLMTYAGKMEKKKAVQTCCIKDDSEEPVPTKVSKNIWHTESSL